MARRRRIARLRDRLVLGQVRPLLAEGEPVAVWAHVQAPNDGRHGIVSVTPHRCLVHWTPKDLADVAIRWDELSAWHVEYPGRGGPVLSLEAGDAGIAVRLPVSSKARAQHASTLLQQVAALAPPGTAGPDEPVRSAGLDLRAERRGLRGHTRRVVVTFLGVLVILVGLLFASPFVPGPGLLTVLAGLAILATEYDWARDVHHWLRQKVERLWARLRARREQRRQQRQPRAGAPDA